VIDLSKKEPYCRIYGCRELQDRATTRYCHRHDPLVKEAGGSEHLPRVRSARETRRGRPRRTEDRYVSEQGYVMIRIGSRYVPEHRVVMMAMLGRPLVRGESVHHRNGVRSDNRPENLELWVGPIRRGARATDLVCIHCGRPWLAEAPAAPKVPIQTVIELIESGAWPVDGHPGISQTFQKIVAGGGGVRGAGHHEKGLRGLPARTVASSTRRSGHEP
jgi:hypothetical protein